VVARCDMSEILTVHSVIASIYTCCMTLLLQDIDFYNPHEKRTAKQACTSTQERVSFANNIIGNGFVDTFRHKYPAATGAYSFWSMRANSRPVNRGLRIDYVCVSQQLKSSINDAFILDTELIGTSDHCPIGAVILF
jgi:exodeoxyribonuclease III